jgi:2'-hydroxyisoflavone reductase
MSTSRRDFLKLSAAGAAATFVLPSERRSFAAEPSAAKTAPEEVPAPLRLLILGGTGFTGPFQVRYALSRGHHVTVFNRGKTHPGELPAGVEQLIGDRNGQLDTLKNRQWDVVIDNPTTLPIWVRDAAQILKGNVDHYIFISTISVYSDNSKPGLDENGPLEKYSGPDPMKETLESLKDSKFQLYGPLKALSELEAEKWFPGQTLAIRPGLIVGPGDESDRFTYWPVRLDRGGPVLAPGAPTDPVQFIDARDLAEWTVRMAEGRQTGIYNATGPAQPFTMGGMLDGIQSAIGSKTQLIWVNSDFLTQQGISPWSDMPVWVPPTGDTAGFASQSIRHALDQGLTFRALADTARDTLAWFKTQPAARQARLHAGLRPERESAVLAAWQAREK